MFKSLKILAKSTALVLAFLGFGVISSSVNAYQKNTANVESSAPTKVDEQIERASFILDMARTDYVSIPDSVTVNRNEKINVYKAIAIRGSDVLLENKQKGATLTRNTLNNYLNEVWNKVKDAPNLYTPVYDPNANPDEIERNACITLFGDVDSTNIAKSGENWAANLKKEHKNINGVDLYEFTLELPRELDDKLNSDEKFKFTVYRHIFDDADKTNVTTLELGSSGLMNTQPELVQNKTPIGPFLMDVAIHAFESGKQFYVDAGEKQVAFWNKLEKNLKEGNKSVMTKEELNEVIAKSVSKENSINNNGNYDYGKEIESIINNG